MIYVEAQKPDNSIESLLSDDYDSVEELLVQEMIETGDKITDKQLQEMSEIYQINIKELREKLPLAEQILYHRLKNNMDIFHPDN